MQLRTSSQDKGVLSPIVKMAFLLELTLEKINIYGGPFTTEQVEDVKTLFRVVTVFVIGSAMFALTEEWSSLKQDVNSLIRNEGTDRQFSKYSSDYLITGMLLHQRNNLNTIIMSFFSILSLIIAHQTPKVITNSLLQDPS